MPCLTRFVILHTVFYRYTNWYMYVWCVGAVLYPYNQGRRRALARRASILHNAPLTRIHIRVWMFTGQSIKSGGLCPSPPTLPTSKSGGALAPLAPSISAPVYSQASCHVCILLHQLYSAQYGTRCVVPTFGKYE